MKSWINFIGSKFSIPIKAERKYVYIIVILAALVIVQTVVLVDFWRQYRPIMPSYTPTFSSDNQSTTSSGYDDADLSGEMVDGSPPEITYPETTIKAQWDKKLIKYNCQGASCNEYIEYYTVGKVLDGEFAGSLMILGVEEGMGTSYTHYALSADGLVNLQSRNVKIAGIDDLPERINFTGTSYQLEKGYLNYLFADVELGRKVFTDPVLGDFYLAKNGCLVVELPDHTAMAYDFVIPFASAENKALGLIFTGGKTNQDAYTYTVLGCVTLCRYLNLIEEKDLRPAERLVLVGKTSNGEDVYGFKNTNDQALKDLYADEGTVAYVTDKWERLPKNKYTYNEFLSYQPYLYWQDPLGRWVEFRNNKFITAAEMCKPVIYLYPEKTAKLSVTVAPNGGFTFTEPEYNNGWQVEATPQSRITDLATGKVYDYLFWEGIGLNYPDGADGWVVAKGDLNEFFDAKLPQLGLRGREIKDFKDYWVNRLQARPYYHLRFLTKLEFNDIAPLNVAPLAPNTVIRVMLTARGLDNYKAMAPQVLPEQAERAGFSVVEWGGVVLP